MELTLGPVLFEWKREEILRFYEEAASMDVDMVYIGEVVCSKKRGLKIREIESIGKMLERSGKKVAVSTLAVISNDEELGLVRDMTALPFPVEANDMAIFNIAPRGKEVFAGPHITSYNVPSIEFLKSIGVRRITFPVELSRDSMAYNIKNTGVEAEVFSHGKVPLAFSWRCYTSRAHGLTKTDCRHDCARYPEGMDIKNLKGEPLFTINGTSVLSALTYTLAGFEEDLKEMGVKALRISPNCNNTRKTVEIFRKRINNRITPKEAIEELDKISPNSLCNGWYTGNAGKDFLAS